MVTADEEAQAKEFLKRAEVRTMKKDLMALREGDALKERDKIAKLKTLEEQIEEQKKRQNTEQSASAKATADKAALEEVLTKNEGVERLAEKDLKNYATEEERQQIFLLESQRLGFEKQVDAIDKEKDPALKLEKNKLLLLKAQQQEKLNSVLEEEKKLEDEQKFVTEKEQTTTIPAQRKSLQESRQDIEKKIEDVEKKRWAAEKDLEDTDIKVGLVDKSSENLVLEKNQLRDKILGADKSIREIYSVVMAREEEKRRGMAQDQIARREASEKLRAKENETVQRQQYSHSGKIPVPVKKNALKSFAAEEEARKKFMQDVEKGAQNSPQQKSNT